MDEADAANAGTPPPPAVGTQNGPRLIVLLTLIVAYCVVPIGSLIMALWIMFLVSANYYIENSDFVSLVTWLATEPNSSIGILQQLIAPIAAAITGASVATLRNGRFVALVVGMCCAAIVCALVVSTLFQLRSDPLEAGALSAIQAFFHGVANTLGVYVLFLLGITGAFKPKPEQAGQT